MKKKFLCVLLSVLAAALVFSGCGLFSGGGDGGSDLPAEIKITDDCTWTIPDDIDYDNYYVIQCDPGDNLVGEMAEFGVLCDVIVIFEKDTAPVAEYVFDVCDTEENANKLNNEYFAAEGGQKLDSLPDHPNILFSAGDADDVKASIDQYASYGMLDKDADAKAYADFESSIYGGFIRGAEE